MNTDIAETEEGIVLAAAQISDNTKIPSKNKQENCISCGTKINHIYCGNCGQKNDDLRRSLWRLIAESLGGIFSFESRVWRTWGALLFKPGKVAREYANGARTTYSPPIRAYLVVTFIFFSFLAIFHVNLFAMSVTPSPEKAKELGIELNQLSETAVITINDLSYQYLFFQTQKQFEATTNSEHLKLALQSMEEKITSNVDSDDQVIAKGFLTFLENPASFNAIFNTWLPRVLFFMVPVAMLLGAIFIRGPNALLYDHLIHAIYIHAMLFSSLPIAIALSRIVPGSIVAKTLIFGFVIYLPVSLKYMFKRGWFKTIITTIFVGIFYTIILFASLITFMAMSSGA